LLSTRSGSNQPGIAILRYYLLASVELEEWVRKWPGHPEHIPIQKDVCESQNYYQLRSAGFIYATPQGLIPNRSTAAIPTWKNRTSPPTRMTKWYG
jgi:hypothetical protein